MREYNGFSSAQRSKAQRWLNAQWAAGTLQRPSRCCACGQTHGVIDAHAEDYSEPFAAGKTDQYPLCFICHMMVHCRFGKLEAWDEYRRLIGDGARFMPFFNRNFPGFQKMFLGDKIRGSMEWHEPRPRRVLDGINGRGGRPPALW